MFRFFGCKLTFDLSHIEFSARAVGQLLEKQAPDFAKLLIEIDADLPEQMNEQPTIILEIFELYKIFKDATQELYHKLGRRS